MGIKRLYFNAANTSILSQDSPNAAVSKYKNKVSNLESLTIELRAELNTIKDHDAEITSQLAKQTKKLESKMNQIQLQKCRLDNHKDELSQLRSREQALENHVKRLKRLESDADLLKQIATLAESSGGGGGDDNEYVDRLIKRGDVTGLKRYNDQIQWAFQQKCQEHRKLDREITQTRHELNRHKRLVSNHEEEQVTLRVKLTSAEKALEASREKNRIISSNLDLRDTTVFDRLITESPLSDDLLARVKRSTFATPREPRKRRSDESASSNSKSIKLESPSILVESPWSDESGFEAAILTNQRREKAPSETPKMKATIKPRQIKTSANMALFLSSDEEAEIEQISPIIGKRQIDIDKEIAFRPKRCKVKLKRPQNGTSKSRSDLDVSKLVKESSLFQTGNSNNRRPNGLGGSSKPLATSGKLKSKNKKVNIGDFFKNTKNALKLPSTIN